MHQVSFEKTISFFATLGSIIFAWQIFIPFKVTPNRRVVGLWDMRTEREVLFKTGTLYSPTGFVFRVRLDKTDTSTHGGNKQEMRFWPSESSLRVSLKTAPRSFQSQTQQLVSTKSNWKHSSECETFILFLSTTVNGGLILLNYVFIQ